MKGDEVHEEQQPMRRSKRKRRRRREIDHTRVCPKDEGVVRRDAISRLRKVGHVRLTFASIWA